jgi:transposase
MLRSSMWVLIVVGSDAVRAVTGGCAPCPGCSTPVPQRIPTRNARSAGSPPAATPPGDWIQRARMIAHSWDGLRTTQIATRLGCHPQTVRERLHRFNAEGVDGLGDRPGPGRPRRRTETERGRIIALARSQPPGRPYQGGEGLLAPAQPEAPAPWTLDALAAAAQAEGIRAGRSQVRRILLSERVRWRPTRSWTTSTDPDFAPNAPRSSPSTPPRPRRRR